MVVALGGNASARQL